MLFVQDEVSNDGSSDEPRERQDIGDGIDVLVRGEGGKNTLR